MAKRTKKTSGTNKPDHTSLKGGLKNMSPKAADKSTRLPKKKV